MIFTWVQKNLSFYCFLIFYFKYIFWLICLFIYFQLLKIICFENFIKQSIKQSEASSSATMYRTLVGSVYLLALVIPGIEYAGDGAAIAFCVLEFISITENGTKVGLPTPAFIKNILAIVKDKSGEGNVK
ncbi:phage holin family protein [Lysinibacillus agricola]|uniref:phage holin family protein n=1 Tax=Lysinibacillus agricola TaxID=2590012 RepID=UPI003C16FA6A